MSQPSSTAVRSSTIIDATETPQRILIVDDHPDILALTDRILERHGYETLTASDGAEALRIAREEHPDLILLDVMIPEVDGLEVCRLLKGSRETCKIMVILVTGRGSTRDLVEGFDAGADDYITKPFQLTEMLARVKSALRIRRLTAEIEARTRELLQAQRERINAEKMATIGLLATGIAHEFNNIMSGIAGFAQLAETNPEYGDRLIEVARTQAARALQITRSLSTFYRPQVELHATDVVPEIENALCLVAKPIKEKSIEVVKRLEDVPAVLAQEGQLQEVFLNLILNAAQAVEEGGTITLRASSDDERVIVEIEDDGPGIPPDDIDSVFDPFFTTKGALGGGTGSGSGLGLSVSYNIVSSYGGTLAVSSRPDEGAVFTISLPRAGAADRPAPRPVETEREGPARPTTVLVADPEDAVRETIAEFMHDSEVAGAADLEELREIAARLQPDFVVVDVAIAAPAAGEGGDDAGDMSGGSGIGEEIDALLERWPDAPLVVTSSNFSSAAFREAARRTDLHLLKPYSMAHLANILSTARRARRGDDQPSRG